MQFLEVAIAISAQLEEARKALASKNKNAIFRKRKCIAIQSIVV
jgi:hypothetical protein